MIYLKIKFIIIIKNIKKLKKKKITLRNILNNFTYSYKFLRFHESTIKFNLKKEKIQHKMLIQVAIFILRKNIQKYI